MSNTSLQKSKEPSNKPNHSMTLLKMAPPNSKLVPAISKGYAINKPQLSLPTTQFITKTTTSKSIDVKVEGTKVEGKPPITKLLAQTLERRQQKQQQELIKQQQELIKQQQEMLKQNIFPKPPTGGYSITFHSVGIVNVEIFALW